MRALHESAALSYELGFASRWHPDLRNQMAMLRVLWGEKSLRGELRALFLNAKIGDTPRIEALRTLIAVNDDSVLAAVDDSLGRSGRGFRTAILTTLGNLSSPRVADVLLRHYETLDPDVRPKAIEILTQRAAWAKKLLSAIGEEKLPASVINANQARRLLAIGDDELTEALHTHWGDVRETRDPGREKFIAEMRTRLLKAEGDAVAGRLVFNKVCGQCHTIYGEGQEVGPDITRNGRGSFEQLLSNVFDPSLVIGADYRAVTVATTDGRVVTGLVVEDSPQRVVLKIQGGKQEIIARGDVAAQKISEVSMMPEGLEKQIKPQEMADLFEFLMLDRPPEDPTAQRLPTSATIESN